MGITLSKKQLSKGRISLYLDICINGKRQKEYLGIILEVPTTKETKKANRTKLELAQAIRNHREMEYLRNRYHTLFRPRLQVRYPHVIQRLQKILIFLHTQTPTRPRTSEKTYG